jgi:hypothetical protein
MEKVQGRSARSQESSDLKLKRMSKSRYIYIQGRQINSWCRIELRTRTLHFLCTFNLQFATTARIATPPSTEALTEFVTTKSWATLKHKRKAVYVCISIALGVSRACSKSKSPTGHETGNTGVPRELSKPELAEVLDHRDVLQNLPRSSFPPSSPLKCSNVCYLSRRWSG